MCGVSRVPTLLFLMHHLYQCGMAFILCFRYFFLRTTEPFHVPEFGRYQKSTWAHIVVCRFQLPQLPLQKDINTRTGWDYFRGSRVCQDLGTHLA